MSILKVFAATVVLSASFTGSALAALATTTGKWSVPIVTDAVVTGTGTNKISWGEATNSIGNNPGLLQSSYEFVGLTSGPAATDGSLFALGDFIHDNETILAKGAGFQGATLSVELGIDSNSGVFNFLFSHLETPNGATPCAAGGTNPCPDKVSFTNLTSSSGIVISGVNYTLEVVGFSTDRGATLISDFITTEAQPNPATLYGRLRATAVAPVPEPASLALLGLGLVGFGFSRRRRAAS